MSSSNFCAHCQGSGNACPHIITDLNRAMPIFPDPAHHGPAEGLQEFQFFGNDDTLAWLFNDPKPSTDQRPDDLSSTQPTVAAAVAPAFNYLDGFRSGYCNPGRLTFDVGPSGTSSPDSIGQSHPAEVPATMGQVASSGNVVSSFIFI